MSGTAVRDSTPSPPPTQSEGGFVPGAELHRSALAVLYLAGRESEQPGSPRYVVRRLLPEHADDGELRALLLREKFVASQVRSRHLTTVVSAFDGPVPFTVMEYVQGFSLEELLRRAAGQTHWVRFLVPAVVDALTALAALHAVRGGQTGASALSHQAPVPRHVLLGLDGIARLTDLTQCVGPGLPWSQACSRRLRVWEMAPEQVLAPAHVDHRCDIFVAGAMLWRVLTGNALFQGSSPQDTLQRVMRTPIPSLQDAGVPMDGAMDRVLRQALARSRHQRLDSASEFADSLRRHALQAGLWAEREEIAEFVAGQWTARMLVATAAPAPRPVSDFAARAEQRASTATQRSVVSPLPVREPEPPASGAHAIPSRFVPSRPSSLPPLVVRSDPARTSPGQGQTDPLLGHTIDPHAGRATKPLYSNELSPGVSPREAAEAESWERARTSANSAWAGTHGPSHERAGAEFGAGAGPRASAHGATVSELWPPSPAFHPSPSEFGSHADPHAAFGSHADPRAAFGSHADPRAAFGSHADPRASTHAQPAFEEQAWPEHPDAAEPAKRRWNLRRVAVTALSALLLGGFAALVISDLVTPVRIVTSPGQIDSAPLAEPNPQVGARPNGDSVAATPPEPAEPAPVSPSPAAAAPSPAVAAAPSPAVIEARGSAREQGEEKPDAAKLADREVKAHGSAREQGQAPATTAPARTRRSSAERRRAAQASESEQAPLPSLSPPSTPAWSAPTRTTDQPEWLKRTPGSEGPSKGPGPQLPDNPY